MIETKYKMEKYIKDFMNLAKNNPEEARKQAKEALIRTGVLDSAGNVKEQIVDR